MLSETSPVAEKTHTFSRSEKLARRYVLIFIIGMGIVPFFGIDISALTVSTLLIIFTFFLVKRQGLFPEIKSWLNNHKLALSLWLAWLFIALIAGMYSPILESARGFESVISWSRLLSMVCYFVFGLCIYLFFSKVPIDSTFMVKGIATVMFVLIVNMFLVYWLYPDLRNDYAWLNKPPGYSNIRHAGYHVAFVSVIFLFIVQGAQNAGRLFLSFLLLCVFWSFNMWMGGRGSVIAALIGSLMFIFLLFINKQEYKTSAVLLLAAVPFGLLAGELLSVFYWNGFFSALDRSVDAANIERFTSGRTDLWIHAMSLIKEQPFTGYGTGLYRFIPGHIPWSHPHNFVLQFAIDWGLIGCLLMLGLLALLGFRLLQNCLPASNNTNFGLACASTATTLVALGMIDGTLYHTQPSFYLMVTILFALNPFSERAGKLSSPV